MAKEHEAAEKALGGGEKKKKLHVHEMHVRRGHAGGYIVKHSLHDEAGQPQMESHEYPLASKEQLLAHVDEHMGDQPDAAPAAGAEPEPAAGAEPGA